MTSATPVMVPPVPTPATTKSTLPSVSRQISSAVVLRWISGFAGLENCWGMKLFGICLFSSSALAMAPFMPLAPSVKTSFAPRIFNSLRRSRLIVSGIVRISFNPFAAATNASAMPVLPLVGSMSTVSGLILPGFQRVVNHRHADAVLDAGERVEEFEFEQHVGDGAVFFRRAVQPHERCVADGFSDVVVDHMLLMICVTGWARRR